MNIDKKLTTLEKEIMKQAEEECVKIREEYKQKKEEAVSRQEITMLSYAYDYIQKNKRQLVKDKNSKILAVTSEYKQKISQKREQMIDEFFSEIRKKLIDFTKSEEYINYLVKNIDSVSAAFSDEKIQVTLYKDDKDFRDEILKIGNVEAVELTLDDIIGGFIVKGKVSERVYDNSFITLLNRERKDFLKNIRI